MTEARRKARIAMLQMGITFEDLAKRTGYSLATIHNLLSNAASMAKGRQALTNALGTQLWNHVPVTERCLHVPTSWGMQIEFPNKKQALDAVDELGPDLVARRGRTITFIKAVKWVAEIPREKTQSAKNRKISARSTE